MSICKVNEQTENQDGNVSEDQVANVGEDTKLKSILKKTTVLNMEDISDKKPPNGIRQSKRLAMKALQSHDVRRYAPYQYKSKRVTKHVRFADDA